MGNDGNRDRSERLSPAMRPIRDWCRRNPVPCTAAGFVLLVAGGLSFLAATGERSVGVSVLLALVGGLLGAIGLLLLNEPVVAFVERSPGRGRLLGFGALAAGAAVVWLAAAIRSPLLVVVGSVIVLLGLLAINAWLIAGSASANVAFLVLGLVLLAAGPAMIWLGDGVDGLSIAGAVVLIVGLVLFKIGLPSWIDVEPRRRRMTASAGAVLATVAGVALLFASSRSFNEGALLFGVTLAVAGLSALGIGAARFDPAHPLALAIAVVGLVGVAAGALLVNGIVALELLTLVVTVVVAAVGAWFVFRGEALIAVLLLGFVAGWALVDRTSPEALDPNPGAEPTVLALGDSYISGEGAAEFFDGTNVVGPDGNQCRRSPSAYPYLVAERLGGGLIFLACSGARTTDMDNLGEPPDPFPEVGGGEDQIQRLLSVHGGEIDDVDAVLVSIGGNDVGFGTIIKACLLPQSCAVPELNDGWLRNVAETQGQLVATYLTLKEAVGEDTPIVAVLYPKIVAPADDCELAIGSDEIDFVVRFTAALNDTVRAAAAEAGINVFEGSADAFEGRLLCDDDPAANFFHLAPTDGPIADTIFPSNWVHGTLHPRGSGHELIADGLVSAAPDGEPEGFLADLLASVDGGGPANPAPGDGPGPRPPEYEDLPDQEWVEEQLYRTVGSLIPPIGLLLLGGLVAAFGLIKARLPFLDFLNPSNNRPPTGST